MPKGEGNEADEGHGCRRWGPVPLGLTAAHDATGDGSSYGRGGSP